MVISTLERSFMLGLLGIKTGLVGGVLALLVLLYLKVKDMFLSHRIQSDENKVTSNNVAISKQDDKIAEDTEKLNEALDDYNKSRSDNGSGNSN